MSDRKIGFWFLTVCLLMIGGLGLTGCDDDDDDYRVPTECVKINGEWHFQFGPPVDFNLVLLARHDEDPDFNCVVYIQDTSVDRSSFNGEVDGQRVRAVVRSGEAWEIRGDISADTRRIEGFYTLGEFEGNFEADWLRPLPQVGR